MYQLDDNKPWQTDHYHALMSDKRIFSTLEAKKIREQFEHLGVLPRFDNNFDWAKLCIAYCFAKNLEHSQELYHKPNTKGYEVPSFTTTFGDESHLWLAVLSENLFVLKQNASKDDLYNYIEQLWHLGANTLFERWQKCKDYAESDVQARQQFVKELMELTSQKSRSMNALKNNDTQLHILATLDKDSIFDALKNLGLPIQNIEFIKSGVRFDKYEVVLDKYFDLSKKHTAICSALGRNTNDIVVNQSNNGRAFCYDLKVLRDKKSWQVLNQEKFKEALRQFSANDFELPFCIGVDENANPIFEDLTCAPHLLVAGTTGSGKSVCMRAILQSLFVLNDDNTKIEVIILDPKMVDYGQFIGEQNLYQQKIIDDTDEMLAVLKESVDEMETRYVLMQSQGVHKWKELRKTEKLPYRIIVIDELADLLSQNKEVESLLIRLAQKARAAGIHLMVSTQSPNSEILSTTLRANIPSRIGLKTLTAKQSEIILDETGAQNLLGLGDHLVKYNGKNTYFAHSYDI